MSTNWPTSKDSLTNPASTDKENSPGHAAQHANANDAIEAMQEEMLDDRTVKSTAYSATVALDRDDGFYQIITNITGDLTVTMANMTAGKRMCVKYVYGDSDAHTITHPGTTKWPSGSAPTLTCTNASSDIFGYVCTGTDTYDGIFVGFDVK